MSENLTSDVTVYELHVDSIKVGERHRKDIGDVGALAESIDTVGLIHPVVVTPDCRLIAGERRLSAMRSLGWEMIPVTVIQTLADATDELIAERDENTCRKDFTPTEAASVRRAVADALAPIAAERKAQAPGQPRGAKVSGSNLEQEKFKTRDVSSRGTGYAPSTLDKVDRTAQLAKDETQPEPVREKARVALAEMDRTGNVDKPFKDVQQAKREAEAPQPDPRVSALIDSDANVQRAKYRQQFGRARGEYLNILSFGVAEVAAVIEPAEWDAIDREIDGVNRWWKKVRAERSTLRIIGGKDV